MGDKGGGGGGVEGEELALRVSVLKVTKSLKKVKLLFFCLIITGPKQIRDTPTTFFWYISTELEMRCSVL
jgi:hypothetical protein